jgi:hypothetical protein
LQKRGLVIDCGDYPEFRPHNATSEREPAGVKLKFYKVS